MGSLQWRLVRVCRTSGRARLVEIVLAQAETPCTISWIMHSTVTTESVSVTNGSLDISGDAVAALAYFGLGEAGNGQETTLNLEEGMYEGAVTAVVDANNNIVSQTQ